MNTVESSDLVMCDHCNQIVTRSAFERHKRKRDAQSQWSILMENKTTLDSDSDSDNDYNINDSGKLKLDLKLLLAAQQLRSAWFPTSWIGRLVESLFKHCQKSSVHQADCSAKLQYLSSWVYMGTASPLTRTSLFLLNRVHGYFLWLIYMKYSTGRGGGKKVFLLVGAINIDIKENKEP